MGHTLFVSEVYDKSVILTDVAEELDRWPEERQYAPTTTARLTQYASSSRSQQEAGDGRRIQS